jgi:predicted amidophosphoribosyltransferase
MLVRIRHTQEQAALNRKARVKNIRHAFVAVTKLAAAHVAIIDDVVTTGSTVNEIAKVLRRAGAQRIEVWAVARAGR